MKTHSPYRSGFAWLELVLALAFLALLFQVFPSLWIDLLSALDIRTWPRTTWFALNLLVLFGLFGVRFGPDLYGDWKQRRSRQRAAGRGQLAASESHTDPDYETRVRRDADWRERARRRLPWHQ